MTSENKAWQDLETAYLDKVEKALSSVKHPHIAEVLEDVRSHLDQRFTALGPNEQNREHFQAIIAQMGPASDYAELLSQGTTSSPPKARGKHLLLASLAIVLIAVVVVLPKLLFRKTHVSAPLVISTTPNAFDDSVSPDLQEITVTFDQPMMNLSWSWVGGGDTFPETTGQPRYDKSKTTCSLPVKLEPGTFYWLGINSPQYTYFQTALGKPAQPYVILFATTDRNGERTEIPENFVEEAEEINSRSDKLRE